MSNCYEKDRIELIVENQEKYINQIQNSFIGRFFFFFDLEIRKNYKDLCDESDISIKADKLSDIINLYQSKVAYRYFLKVKYCIQDGIIWAKQTGRREIIDYAPKRRRDYVAIACIVKNEAKDIVEWIEFHKLVGVDRIYLFDNESTDNIKIVLSPYINEGFVIYINWKGKKVQTSAYRYAIRKYRNMSRWIALIDSDEFLFSPSMRLKEALKKYEEYPGVCVNWVVFGPSGYRYRPVAGVLASYIETPRDSNNEYNCRVKSIVNPREVFIVNSPHFALYRNNKEPVNEKYQPVTNYAALKPALGRAFTFYNNREILRLNHYITKSLEDLENKCKRGYADGHKNAVMEEQLGIFECELTEDRTVQNVMLMEQSYGPERQ